MNRSASQSYMLKVLRIGEPALSLTIDAPGKARRYWNAVIRKQTWFDDDKEHLVVLLLSTKCDVEGYTLVSIGSLSESIAHPREIFRAAIAGGCYGIVVMHNHPSGNPCPGPTDRSLTCRLKDAADLLQIRLFDHVIVGRIRRKAVQSLRPARMSFRKRNSRKIKKAVIRRGYFSFAEEGIL